MGHLLASNRNAEHPPASVHPEISLCWRCWIQDLALYLLEKKLPRFDFSSMKKQLHFSSDWKGLITLHIFSYDDIWSFTFFIFIEVVNSWNTGIAFPVGFFKLLAPPSGCNCSQRLPKETPVVSVISLPYQGECPYLLEKLHFSMHYLEVRNLGN